MKRNKIFWSLALFLFCSILNAEEFRFKYNKGDQFKMVSTVDQMRYYNGIFIGQAQMLYKISILISDVQNNSGYIEADFHIATNNQNTDYRVYTKNETYPSRFWKDPLGRYTIEPQYYMPVARGIPTFPPSDIPVGYSWRSLGEEVHDLRTNFNIEEPFHTPFVSYNTFDGYEEIDGKKYAIIRISYDVNQGTSYTGDSVPVLFKAASRQKMYWDVELGWPAYVEEVYDIILHLSDGSTARFTGKAWGKTIPIEKMNKSELTEEIQKDINSMGIEDTRVEEGENGVSLIMENIQFYPDSDEFLPGEEEKLRKIANILIKYPQRDILVEGHTALAGTQEGRQLLSEARAAKVGQLLIEWGIRQPENLVIQGFGAQRPIAGNGTEEERRRNRRVEITILEN